MPKIFRDPQHFNQVVYREKPGELSNGHSEPPKPDLVDEANILSAIRRDLSDLGIAGEEDNLLCLYLVGTSRKLQKPLSALVIGDSSTGKSTLIQSIASLIPESEILRATRITPQALYHEQEPLSHKFIVGGERSLVQDEQAADATAALRQLRSEGIITKRITERDGDRFVTREVTISGPVAFVESTTMAKSKIFTEDLNRSLILRTDGSEQQNRRAIETMGRSSEVEYSLSSTDPIARRHNTFQRSLKSYRIGIPYISKLTAVFPATSPQCRRVFAYTRSMIETITIINQYKREVINGKLIATLEDYTEARSVLLDPIWEAIGFTDEEEARYDTIKITFKNKETFTAGMLAGLIQCSKPTSIKYLRRLQGLGVVECVSEGVSRVPDKWRLTGNSPSEYILPLL